MEKVSDVKLSSSAPPAEPADPASGIDGCCARLLALAYQAQELASHVQGVFYGCYNQKIIDAFHKSLDTAVTLVQNSTVQCRACMNTVYNCICETIKLKQ